MTTGWSTSAATRVIRATCSVAVDQTQMVDVLNFIVSAFLPLEIFTQ